jgi:hypothetical protein
MFTASDGTPLVALKEGSEKGKLSDIFKLQSMVEIRPAARDLAELPLLTLLGWYLMVLRQEDTAAAAGAVAAAS